MFLAVRMLCELAKAFKIVKASIILSSGDAEVTVFIYGMALVIGITRRLTIV